MKRKIYYGVALLTCAAAISVFAASQRTETSALLRANIEALTNNEDGTDGGESGAVKIPCLEMENECCDFTIADVVGREQSVHLVGYINVPRS